MNGRTMCGVVLTLLTASASHADTTFTLQNGVNGYAGGQDVSINTQYSQYNGGNGVQWSGTPELGCYTVTGTGGYTVRYLLKFGGISISAGSTVVSATLAISLDSWNNGSGNITGFYLKNTWNATSSRLGWLHRDDSHDWAGPGASSAGVDTVAGKSFQVPPLRPVGVQTVTIPLDVAQVQAWIDSPAANQGIMLVNNNPGEVVNPVSTAGTQKQRPKLTIVISSGTSVSVSVSPSTAALATGATQQFTSTVTGASNTAVTWTATGGSITTAGLFTAGQTAGPFQVKATSVQDTTKSATATVTINAPPAVSVSVSPTTATLLAGATQQFTATVTGASNTAVTWTATGGTITTAGLFTAGPTAGSNFTVTATSVADTTKSATAHLTIQAVPVVSVSVSPTSATVQPGHSQQFIATVTGSSNATINWTATGGTISSSGLYSAGQTTGNFTVTAMSAADPSKSATATVHIDTGSGLPPVPRQTDGPYVVVQSPVMGMHLTAPAMIRIYADPYDGNAPDPDALTVTFLMNGQSVGTFTGSGAQNGYFPFTVTNVAAGTYTITAQITASGRTVTSTPVTVFVDNPAASSGPVFNLTADVVLSGSQGATYAGTATNHCLINGNGFQIRTAAGFTGSLTITNCDIRNLGTATKPATDVTVNGSGSVQLIGNVLESFGTVSIGANDQAQAVVRGNEFRENTLVPVGSQPADTSTETIPVFIATGNSSTQKFFQGNNVGLSTVVFQNTRNWLIGGSTDAESNVLMGVRCGFTISGSTSMVLRGNYSQHNYPHRFSQGENFQLDGDGFLVEHNVIRSSSWPVRGVGGEIRYNLIDASGNSDQVFQAPMSNANIHHNVFSFTVSQTFYSPGAGLRLMYNVDNVQFHNNVMDGGGTFMDFNGSPIVVIAGSFLGSLRNNVFYNFTISSNGPVLAGDLGESTNPPLQRLRYSDYNDFYNPDAPDQTNYGLGVVGHTPGTAGYGMHDLGGINGHVNPKFTAPTALPFPFRPEDIWTRTKKVSDVLAMYRMMYSPATGSPLIGAGDPQDGTGGNIGAVGNGEATDQFGLFGNGSAPPPPPPPALPVIASFSASPATIQLGQSATLSWSVTGATSLSIAPAPGAVIGSSVTVSPTATTTYTLTATNSSGSASSTTTLTVTSAAPNPAVSVSPTSATLFMGGTQQFTATVTGMTNTAVTWTATGGGITTTGLFTAGQATGSFQVTATSVQDSTMSATAAVTIVTQSSGGHPRIILDAPTLATLRARATANTSQWRALKGVCDSMIGGTVEFPGGNGYPDLPSVGEGYQGSSYLDAMMPLGICYHVLKNTDPTTAAKYGAKAIAILSAMSDPAHQTIGTTPIVDRDDGYGIRFYGVTMGMGYDWFHDLLTPALETQLQNVLNSWIHGWENDDVIAFEYEHPLGNYYAGYYAAKCMSALAVQGDSPLGDTWWNDWYNRVHNQFLAPYFAINMAGGGWPEGFANYGPLSTRNLALPALAVRSAKGIDLIHASQPYPFPLDQARWAMSFTWPSRDFIDDRDSVQSRSDGVVPGTPDANSYSFLAGYLAMWNDPLAPAMHRYARDAKAALASAGVGSADEWIEFLFWDNAAPEADYSTFNLSYLAPGIGEISARSDWTNAATWMSLRSGPYINNPGAGHQGFDAGSLALVRGKSPLLVNADGWVAHDPNGNAGENAVYDDNFGNWDADHTQENRRLYNTFQVRHVDAGGNILDHFGEWATQRSDGARTTVSRYEDGGSYVLALGQFLEDMYRPFTTICNASPVTSWSRQVLYLRPSQFVVYDRTGICNSSLDQYMAFHFPGNLVEMTAPAAGVRRFDVTAGTFAGSMTTILPANAGLAITDHVAPDSGTWGKVWRAEIRPTGAATAARQWLTTFDLAGSSSQVAAATPLTVMAGAVVGAVLASPAGNNVTVFGTAPAGTPVSGTITYVAPAAQTRHVITDLTPQTAYTVSVTISGGSHVVTVNPGGNLHATANGVLTFAVSASGVLQ